MWLEKFHILSLIRGFLLQPIESSDSEAQCLIYLMNRHFWRWYYRFCFYFVRLPVSMFKNLSHSSFKSNPNLLIVSFWFVVQF
jgi:hypothetical protein